MPAVVVPCFLAAGYLVLLVIRFPRLLAWERGDSDSVSFFTLLEAIAHGHAGPVLVGTQGTWLELWGDLLSAGLPFHRLLWEIMPAAAVLASTALIAWSVAQVAGRRAAALTFALVVAASPVALITFIAPQSHDLTIAGTAGFGAYLVWLSLRPHSRLAIAVSIVGISLFGGILLASHQLLAVTGLAPFLGATMVVSFSRREQTGLFAVLSTTAGALVVAAATTLAMKSYGLTTNTPTAGVSTSAADHRLVWLGEGLFRLVNGATSEGPDSLPVPLLVLLALVLVCAIAASFWVALKSLKASRATQISPARALHSTFWPASALCAGVAYVLTNVTTQPSDRYLITAGPALGATVPLLLTHGRRAALVSAAASVVIAASLVNLASDHEIGPSPAALVQMSRIEALATALHVRVGYAGYWNADSLTWASGGRLTVYPLISDGSWPGPGGLPHPSIWYRPRRHTPSYLLLAPGDRTLPDRLPRRLPRPQREYRLGQVTLATYPYDLAAYLNPNAP